VRVEERLTGELPSGSIAAMADSPRLTRATQKERAQRDERLARALRENLRRRKQQARAKEQPAAEPATDPSGDEPPA
jgi:hypothetical protein